MSIEFNNEEEHNEKQTNVIPFPTLQLITGGGGIDGDWLATLPQGAIFLCRPRNSKTSQLLSFRLEWCEAPLALICTVLNERHEEYVRSDLWSQEFELEAWRRDGGIHGK
jgi:hypothetical protein